MAINYKNGKDAVTHYKVLERFGNATYIECRLETGRTHQIRVHMTSLGHPLLGDEIYAQAKILIISRDRLFMPWFWALFTQEQESIWNFPHLCQNIFLKFC